MDDYRLKDEIIDFVRNAPEETNVKVAVFIEGMQAQKMLMDRRWKTDCCLVKNNEENLPGVQTNVP